MFEKEAEEYAVYTRIKDKNTYIDFPDESISEVQDFEGNYIDVSERIIKTFKDASEFGYNKANEWHELRKNPNDLPKDTDSLYLVRVYTWDSNLHDFYKKYSFHIPTVCYWNGKRFIALDNMAYSNAISDSIAWKEIVSPKEDEIESEMFPEITLPEGSSEFIDKVIADAEKRVKEKNK